jgi:chloramphenicol-sensitive protein RarD
MTPSETGRRSLAGVAYASAAYLTWGLFPLYFRALAGVPAPEILAHRIAWSLLFVAALVTLLRRWEPTLRQLRAPGTLPRLAASALLISSNWLVYIWAVNSEHVLQASLGYFINPLVTVLLGVLFQGERLTRRQVLAVAIAAAGVGALVVRTGQLPWVSLSLAITFGLYGLVRKRVPVDAVAGLLAEVGVLAPLALLYLGWLERSGAAHFLAGPRQTALLAASGAITAIPLIWFALGVQRLRLTTVGLLLYLNPTVQFAIAVFAFGEPFTQSHAIAFGCIWISLAIYTAEALGVARRGPSS